MNVAEAIKFTRQKVLMNQEDFAKSLNVSIASVNRWEVGKSIPNLTAMKSIKSFCEKYNQSYEMIETAWITVRMEDRK